MTGISQEIYLHKQDKMDDLSALKLENGLSLATTQCRIVLLFAKNRATLEATKQDVLTWFRLPCQCQKKKK